MKLVIEITDYWNQKTTRQEYTFDSYHLAQEKLFEEFCNILMKNNFPLEEHDPLIRDMSTKQILEYAQTLCQRHSEYELELYITEQDIKFIHWSDSMSYFGYIPYESNQYMGR